jgi:hypothetical protein
LSWMERTVSTLQFLSTFSFPLSALHEMSFKIIFISSVWIRFPRVTGFLVVKEYSYIDWRGFYLYARFKDIVSFTAVISLMSEKEWYADFKRCFSNVEGSALLFLNLSGERKKNPSLSPRTKYTKRVTAACRRN